MGVGFGDLRGKTTTADAAVARPAWTRKREDTAARSPCGKEEGEGRLNNPHLRRNLSTNKGNRTEIADSLPGDSNPGIRQSLNFSMWEAEVAAAVERGRGRGGSRAAVGGNPRVEWT
jgi:hypothetical protein